VLMSRESGNPNWKFDADNHYRIFTQNFLESLPGRSMFRTIRDRSQKSNVRISGKIETNLENGMNFEDNPESKMHGCLKGIINFSRK
jgi:hypothetical protein